MTARTIPIRHYGTAGCICPGPQNGDVLCPCEREQRRIINQNADRRRALHEDPTLVALRAVEAVERSFDLVA